MKILAIGTSNSRHSINRELASHAASLIEGAEVEVINIAEFEMPIFSEEREQVFGRPLQARSFYQKIGQADALVISFAEHNGSYTAAWKNLFDWVSRIDRKVFQQKPTLFLSTSPGQGGAKSVLASAVSSAGFFGASLVDSISVPSFHENFDTRTEDFVDDRIRIAVKGASQKLATAAVGKKAQAQSIT